jgi:Lon protease-like protein
MAGPIPLFMLRTVLFPHMPLALHVFEPRYRSMMADCLEQGTSFGVVAIREGWEVGDAAVPRDIGTLAKILKVERLDDGRMNLLISGASRFRVLGRVAGKPYAQAEVEYLSEGDDSVPGKIQHDLVTRFQRYVKSLELIAPGANALTTIPTEPEILGYLVAATLETALETRQQLLEATDVRDRMERELAILRFENDLLKRRVVPHDGMTTAFSSN